MQQTTTSNEPSFEPSLRERINRVLKQQRETLVAQARASAFKLWLVRRFLTSGQRLLNLPATTSLIGMALGVASLMVAMGVVSGFETALRTAIVDVFGDVAVIKRGERPQNIESILGKIKQLAPEAETFTPFLTLEGIITGQGKLAGVAIQGFDPKSVEQVLNLRSRIVGGSFSFGKAGEFPQAMVGKALAKRFGLKVGESFKIVLPTPSRSDSTGFSPKVMSFVLAGILDLGKIEYDSRFVVTDLQSAQEMSGVADAFTGIRIRLNDSDKASRVSAALAQGLGVGYFVMDWTEVNRNLFEAVKIERIAIFFVILIMVIAASFNISSNLFVSVLKKYSDVSILRALGFSARDVMKVFVFHGLFFGVIGTVAGLILGSLLCVGFVVAQKYVVLMPVETYGVDHVGVQIRFWDLAAVIFSALVICLISVLIPARRGAKLDPVEGLRYE